MLLLSGIDEIDCQRHWNSYLDFDENIVKGQLALDLYARLPKKLGFELTEPQPEFLMKVPDGLDQKCKVLSGFRPDKQKYKLGFYLHLQGLLLFQVVAPGITVIIYYKLQQRV